MPDEPPRAPADLSNWRSAPFSRWAFHHVDRVLPVATIARNVARPLTSAASTRSSPLQRSFLKTTSTDAFVVLENGRVTCEHYANGNAADTPHILMSATKAVCGLVAETLEHAGALDLGKPVSAYVPEVAGTLYGAASLRALLDMRVEAPLAAEQNLAYANATGWEPVPLGTVPETLQDCIVSLPAKSEALEGPFRYLSLNTDLAGWAIERATGTPLAEIVETVLWKPMGAERDAGMTIARGGLPRAAGGLCATVRDFARIGQLFVDDGRAGDLQVIPSEVIRNIAGGGDREAWRAGEWGRAFGFISRDMSYRSGWYVIHERPGLLFAMGIHGQNLFVDVPNKIVIAKFSSWAKPIDYALLPLTHASIDLLLRRLRARAR